MAGLLEKPGEGAKAEEGTRLCEPVIQALEAYRQRRTGYPERLEGLVPDHLQSLPAAVGDRPIEYALTGSSYRLRFRYAGPGMNTCVYTPEARWRCTGYHSPPGPSRPEHLAARQGTARMRAP
jgi:hypothetical protein